MCETCRHCIKDILLVINGQYELDAKPGRFCELLKFSIKLDKESCEDYEQEVEYEDS